jgi:glycosyltransferase involved in cell wall biosynthesis
MNTYPKISVVVPSFNQAKFLELTLLSIIEQDYPEFELIVIDGGSKDESPDIIHKYQQHMKFWCSEPDGGHSQGLIKGFSHATGEILCFLNSDDLFEPGVLREVGEYFSQHPDVDIVFGDTTWIDAKGNALRRHKEIPFNRFIWFYTYNYIPGMSAFWRRSIYDRVGGISTTYRLAFDTDLWIRFSDAHAKFKHVTRQWSRMRFYPEQNCRRLHVKVEQDDMAIRSRYWKNHTVPKTYYIRRKIAISLRILWRLMTGCYGLPYHRYLEKVEKI